MQEDDKASSLFFILYHLFHNSHFTSYSTLSRAFSPHKASLTTMSIHLHPRAYADNTPSSRSSKPDLFSPTAALESLKFQLSESPQPSSTPRFQVLPFRNGRPLASSSSTAHSGDSQQIWHLGWINLGDLKVLLESSGGQLNGDSLVYVGSCSEDDVVYWAIDVSSEQGLLPKLGSKKHFCFVELRSLMVSSD